MKYVNYILIIIGAFVAMYAKVDGNQNQVVLIIGIVLLMIGVYRISKTIPSRKDDDDTTFNNEN
ncbi:hypothetical protein KFZ70_15395 [Tamlana fucoidanivorans]|uniref:Uncharacterized protein n=1 Tax=Allotamlana fucoidanivorans TaxID=2583814 RepID=A0A5C4SF28_9FLAO|nr:hypothetical protein [Tamlana fucoidanivorans]TNJ42162.1 hypothetical protein FGF67_14785 [Tamlana fucoidanivorans]